MQRQKHALRDMASSVADFASPRKGRVLCGNVQQAEAQEAFCGRDDRFFS